MHGQSELTLELVKDDKRLIEFWQDWVSGSRMDVQGGYPNCVTFRGAYAFVASADHNDAPRGEVYTVKEAVKEAAYCILDYYQDLADVDEVLDADIFDYLRSK